MTIEAIRLSFRQNKESLISFVNCFMVSRSIIYCVLNTVKPHSSPKGNMLL